jgi:hypothetical protein
MVKLSISALAIVVCLTSTLMLTQRNRSFVSGMSAEASFATDGAFRDGLYLGKLAAELGQAPRPATGRWSTDRDRSLFAIGYRRGYESLGGVVSAHSTN